MNRIEILQNEIKMHPNDPFNYYLMALENVKNEEYITAKEYFELLLNQFEEYLATYYTYANFLIDIGEEENAEIIIHKGIKISFEQKNSKAEKELKQLLELNF